MKNGEAEDGGRRMEDAPNNETEQELIMDEHFGEDEARREDTSKQNQGTKRKR